MLSIINTLFAWLTARRTDDRGATMVEYGLMVALVAVVVAIAATVLGNGISSLFDTTNTSL